MVEKRLARAWVESARRCVKLVMAEMGDVLECDAGRWLRSCARKETAAAVRWSRLGEERD